MVRFNSLADWLSWQEGFHPRSIDLGLERAAGVFKKLNPDGIKPPSIVVAGTNGKGSSVAFLEAIYRAQGYRVGAYTSPHILKYNERIRIDGQPVDDETICQSFERIDALRNDVSLSYFEFGTLAALDIFWRSDLDVQILEVGLGGRLDAVNIIDADVSLITSICIDHIDWLGETREAIAYEKSGVFRTEVPAVIGELEAPESLLQSAADKKTPLFRINHEFSYEKAGFYWNWQSSGSTSREYKALPAPGLKGEQQYRNASSVLMAITEVEQLLPVSEASIRKGLQTVELNGRFQLIEGKVPVLLDAAHNPQAVIGLSNYLIEHFSGKNIHAVFTMMKDKDINGVIDIIKPVISQWYFAPLSNPRAVAEADIKEHFKQCEVSNVSLGFKQFSETISAAKKRAKEGDLILVFGSFFLVSEYLAWNKRGK